jgi:hypothetical protein
MDGGKPCDTAGMALSRGAQASACPDAFKTLQGEHNIAVLGKVQCGAAEAQEAEARRVDAEGDKARQGSASVLAGPAAAAEEKARAGLAPRSNAEKESTHSS